jgi:hypothetical protein
MLGDGGKMKLDTDLFPVSVIEFEHKKVLVCIDQAATTRGKNIVVSDDLRNKMIKPQSPEVGVWRENTSRKPTWRVKPTSSMLIEKYTRMQQQCARLG